MEFVMPMRISCSRYKSSMERTDLLRDKRTDGQQETPWTEAKLIRAHTARANSSAFLLLAPQRTAIGNASQCAVKQRAMPNPEVILLSSYQPIGLPFPSPCLPSLGRVTCRTRHASDELTKRLTTIDKSAGVAIAIALLKCGRSNGAIFG